KLRFPKYAPHRLKYLLLAGVMVCSLSGWSQNFSKVSTTSLPALPNANSQWADFNDDGLLDLFISGVQSGGAYHTAVYTNNGDNTFNVINLTPLTDVNFALGDYNRDGYIDIVTSGVNAGA